MHSLAARSLVFGLPEAWPGATSLSGSHPTRDPRGMKSAPNSGIGPGLKTIDFAEGPAGELAAISPGQRASASGEVVGRNISIETNVNV